MAQAERAAAATTDLPLHLVPAPIVSADPPASYGLETLHVKTASGARVDTPWVARQPAKDAGGRRDVSGGAQLLFSRESGKT